MDRIFDKTGKSAHPCRSFGLRPVDEVRAAERRAAAATRPHTGRSLTRPFQTRAASR